ncbi:LPXTG cell wall anchor domain-containing protein [Aerococcus vaginalis]
MKAETTDNTTASQGEQATAETTTDKLPQTGLATAGLGLGVLFTSIGSAFAFKKRH